MECFYASNLDSSTRSLVLEGDESRHLRVLRCTVGDRILLSNGSGIRGVGIITAVERDRTHVVIERIEHFPAELPFILSVAIGLLAAQERMEWLLEKCTELGVHRIQPLCLEYSEIERLRRPERLQAKMIAALKQSQRSVLPILDQPKTLEEVLADADGAVVVCDPRGTAPEPPQGNCLIVVGAEGGFSPREEQMLEGVHCQRWSLGGFRLRSETAAIAAVSIVASAWQS